MTQEVSRAEGREGRGAPGSLTHRPQAGAAGTGLPRLRMAETRWPLSEWGNDCPLRGLCSRQPPLIRVDKQKRLVCAVTSPGLWATYSQEKKTWVILEHRGARWRRFWWCLETFLVVTTGRGASFTTGI